MGLKCGIVGLPNVGKSTLFNALTSTQAAAAANYPFCTIEPNTGIVNVPDERLNSLSEISNSQTIIPTAIEFVDIAGLVSGASKGEGLGNQFLSHIREVDAIIHVVRCFENSDITHVHGKVDPLFDIEIIETELILSDLESVEKRVINTQKKANSGDKIAAEQLSLLKDALSVLSEGKTLRTLIPARTEEELSQLQLITSKPILYVANVLESEASSGNKYSEQVLKKAQSDGAKFVVISSKIEEEISQLESLDDKNMFLSEIGLEETGLSKIIKQAYNLLGLQSYFTVGPKEARAWTFKAGTKAPQAAGIIHTDFEKGFIRAEVISYDDYITHNGEQKCKEVGKMRLEGKEYVVKDGDVIHFRFNV
jgi:GTP-binding protein YchF